MKKNLLLLFALLISAMFVNAQSYELEPNNTILQNQAQNTFTAPDTIGAYITNSSNADSVDFFKIVLPYCTSWVFNILNTNGTPAIFKMYLYNGQNTANNWIITSSGTTFDFNSLPLPVILNTGGEIYVKIDQTGGTSIGGYSLEVRPEVTPLIDVWECNNILSDAAHIPIDTTISLKLWGWDARIPNGLPDRDYFKAIAPQCGVLNITASNIGAGSATEQDILISVYQDPDTINSIGPSVGSGLCNSSTVTSITFGSYLVKPGNVYIKVEDLVGSSGICNQSYNLSPIEFNLDLDFDISDSSECNNSFLSGDTISSNSSRQIKLWGLNNTLNSAGIQDRDYFVVDIPQQCSQLTVTASNIGGGASTEQDILIAVYQPDTLTLIGTPAGSGLCNQNTVSGSYIVQPGIAYIKVTDLVGSSGICNQSYNLSNIPFNFIVNVSNCTGISELNDVIKFSIVPNPTRDNLTITLIENNINSKLKISNVIGENIYEQDFSNQSYMTIDVSKLSKGVYFVTVDNSLGRITKKFIKE